MVLENVKEMWTETPRLASGKKGRPINKDRFISKMYVPMPTFLRGKRTISDKKRRKADQQFHRLLRGDSVILVLLS